MPRPPRLEFLGALYHVTARGNERREIFRDDRDREEYLARADDAGSDGSPSAIRRYAALVDGVDATPDYDASQAVDQAVLGDPSFAPARFEAAADPSRPCAGSTSTVSSTSWPATAASLPPSSSAPDAEATSPPPAAFSPTSPAATRGPRRLRLHPTPSPLRAPPLDGPRPGDYLTTRNFKKAPVLEGSKESIVYSRIRVQPGRLATL